MIRNRDGFTLPELMIVVMIIGIITMMAVPRMGSTLAGMRVRAARQETTSMLVLARSAAVQGGRETRFVRTGNVVRVLADSNGIFVPLVNPTDLYFQHRVTVSLASSQDTIRFDPRGVAIGLSATGRIKFTHDTAIDSVCVSRLGKAIAVGCNA